MNYKIVITFSIFVFALNSQSEYRAYTHKITNINTGKERLVTTTLDPDQYSGYFPLFSGETLSMQSTWMCRGRTDNFTPICPNPKPSIGPGSPTNSLGSTGEKTNSNRQPANQP